MITGAIIMAVGVLLGAAIAGMNNKKPGGVTYEGMTVVKNNHPAASSDD